MSDTNAPVEITLRIPGDWPHPGALLERLPEGFRINGETLSLPDGTEIELIPMPPDDQFGQIFESSCRQPATADELATVRRYTVNIGLNGPGGSLETARAMMAAGAAIVKAGGAGVFIDNSALAHGGGQWIEMTNDGSTDALSYAFVSLIGGDQELRTMGMQVLGYPDLVLRCTDRETDADTLVEVIRYVCGGEKPVGDGHVICDEYGPRYHAAAIAGNEWEPGSPMHNPFGRLRLVSIKDVAEGN